LANIVMAWNAGEDAGCGGPLGQPAPDCAAGKGRREAGALTSAGTGARRFPTKTGIPASQSGVPPTELEPTMPTTKRAEPDACSLLDTDHRNVKKLFKVYEELANSKASSASQKKRDLANEICTELTVHAQIEEEIFYPALRGALKETGLLDEAEVEHASAKDLIAQIQEATDVDDMFDAKVTVLGEYIDHHVKEERNEIFVKARAARGLDLMAMRDELATRKEELMAELTGATA
jgi:hemerythrin superfamily protein